MPLENRRAISSASAKHGKHPRQAGPFGRLSDRSETNVQCRRLPRADVMPTTIEQSVTAHLLFHARHQNGVHHIAAPSSYRTLVSKKANHLFPHPGLPVASGSGRAKSLASWLMCTSQNKLLDATRHAEWSAASPEPLTAACLGEPRSECTGLEHG